MMRDDDDQPGMVRAGGPVAVPVDR
jgi:hypothetical protein